MHRQKVDLSLFDNTRDAAYVIGRPFIVRSAWFFLGLPLLRLSLVTSSSMRVSLLKLFGATIGKDVVVKPGVRVKFPWKLTIGDYSWIGEDCWIDNLATVTIGRNVCISQGAYLCTGSHNWSDPAFALVTRSIIIEDGAWIGAQAALAPGTIVEDHAVIGLSAMASGRIPAYEIHVGNPARFSRHRIIGSETAADHSEQTVSATLHNQLF